MTPAQRAEALRQAIRARYALEDAALARCDLPAFLALARDRCAVAAMHRELEALEADLAEAAE